MGMIILKGTGSVDPTFLAYSNHLGLPTNGGLAVGYR
jgi:hypothetical protein